MTVQAEETEAPLLGQGDEETQEELSKDQVYHLLQNERRRNVLRYLEDVEGPVQMRDVAEQVAAWEHDTTVQALMSDERQRVYIALYQAHLPKLDEEGVIEYNQSRGIVEKTPLAEQLFAYLDAEVDDADDAPAPGTERPWQSYYLGVSGVGVALVAAAGFDVATFAGVSDLAVALFVLTLYTLLTFGQVLEDVAADRLQ